MVNLASSSRSTALARPYPGSKWHFWRSFFHDFPLVFDFSPLFASRLVTSCTTNIPKSPSSSPSSWFIVIFPFYVLLLHPLASHNCPLIFTSSVHTTRVPARGDQYKGNKSQGNYCQGISARGSLGGYQCNATRGLILLSYLFLYIFKKYERKAINLFSYSLLLFKLVRFSAPPLVLYIKL